MVILSEVIGGAIVKKEHDNFIDNEKATLWNKIRNRSKFIETQMDPLERKRTGSFFTGLELTDIMMQELVSQLVLQGKDISQLKFLEPCVGTGNFVFSYLREISKLSLGKKNVEKIINNIYVADINQKALLEYESLFSEFVQIYFDVELSKDYFSSHIGTALLVDVMSEKPKYVKLKDVFPEEVVKEGFDIVATNPPYKNLKAEKGQYSNIDEYEKDKSKYSTISKMMDQHFHLSTEGVLNLYKLFVEEIVNQYVTSNGFVSLLIPSSILSDKTCSKLRTNLLMNNKIISIKVINEGSGFIDAQQALSTLLIQKGEKTDFLKITKDYCNYANQTTDIWIDDILNKKTNNAIFAINNQEYYMLKQLRQFPVIKELDFIVNLRGELDLTANKNSVVNVETGFPLLRGRDIGYYELKNASNCEFVTKDFVEKSKKAPFIKKERIICQQVVNIHKKRRLTFSIIEPNKVLGNSCNFISVTENRFGIDLYSILGLLNTSIMNWLFKLTSSNNHVNNYEIDSFPIPIESPYMKNISNLVKKYIENKDISLLEKIEEYAIKAYKIQLNEEDTTDKGDIDNVIEKYYTALKNIVNNITLDDATSIITGQSSIDTFLLQKCADLDSFSHNILLGITDKFVKMSKGIILNHTTFKLSDLDLEMIGSVPPGGNWKSIPLETVEKSRRLKRITETGGRTTLYGRIDYSKPSYTITTYFNRPGNGTYVHPVHDRVLSVREAARFQCFKDDYYFWGNKSQVLKQVGNAVPSVLAYQISKQIIDKTNCRKSIDLFCGAGGMTEGFKEAGVHSVLSNDIEVSACTTLKINNPEINVFCGDITQSETKKHIVNVAINEGADIICGGPPCQGFSMAGNRLADDPRNQLFKDFIEIVSKVKPKIIVFENVVGLLSFQGGKTYQAILDLFSDVGYVAEGRILMASEYGVPQKRKRVIIICTRKDQGIKPSDLFPLPITKEVEKQVTARETIVDLEGIDCNENALYVQEDCKSDILKLFKGKLGYFEYVNNHSTSQENESVINMNEENHQLSFNL